MLEKIIKTIEQKNKIHANNINNFIQECDEDFLKIANEYLESYCNFLMKSFDKDIDFIINSYLFMVQSIVVEQTRFMRNGHYRYSTLEEADKNVYSNKEYMFQYMIGVALSQFLWKNHKEMFEFFKSNMQERTSSKKYLEIGCGHGLFFLESIKHNKFASYKAIDISETSLNITKRFTKEFFGEIPNHVEFIHQDVNKADKSFGSFDFIAMGEVLEHVESPKELLSSIYRLLSDEGNAYISTCVNCPVKDHIYLYNEIEDIRKDFLDSGLKIVNEIIISNDNIPEEEWISKKANLSYAAIVKKI